jgi:SH3 domain-containing YSC84-like protein 1
MRAEILSYARSRGLFAGISLQGSVVKTEGDDNTDLYGHKVDDRELLFEGGEIPKTARKLIGLLEKYDKEALPK